MIKLKWRLFLKNQINKKNQILLLIIQSILNLHKKVFNLIFNIILQIKTLAHQLEVDN